MRQVIAEFFGTMLFQMFGGSAPAKDTTAPAANGFALVALSELGGEGGRHRSGYPGLSLHSMRRAGSKLHRPKSALTEPKSPNPMTAVYAFANVSGGHLNPAVSFALICTGHMKWWVHQRAASMRDACFCRGHGQACAHGC